MNAKPRPAKPGGAIHVAHTLTVNGSCTLTLSDAEHLVWHDLIDDRAELGC